MAISISFSAFIYYGSSMEFDRVLRVQRFRIEHPNIRPPIKPNFLRRDEQSLSPRLDPEVANEARVRVLIALFGVNVVILLLSSLLGYFLAGRTLRPIKEMINEQNRFVTNASHEFNTPITSLKTTIEVNLRDKNLNLSKAKKVLESNLEEVNSLQLLSYGLLNLAKYQKIYGNFKSENFLLLDVINQALAKIKSQANEKRIKFKLDISKKLTVRGNQKSFIELFVILFDNAVKYSRSNKQVSVLAKKTDTKITIEVKDQGIGIAKEDVPYVFNRFYRSEESRTKQQVGGYGLGLSIAKSIVSLHNGNIELESSLKKGTTVTININV